VPAPSKLNRGTIVASSLLAAGAAGTIVDPNGPVGITLFGVAVCCSRLSRVTSVPEGPSMSRWLGFAGPIGRPVPDVGSADNALARNDAPAA
jgi:hypothetical protein